MKETPGDMEDCHLQQPERQLWMSPLSQQSCAGQSQNRAGEAELSSGHVPHPLLPCSVTFLSLLISITVLDSGKKLQQTNFPACKQQSKRSLGREGKAVPDLPRLPRESRTCHCGLAEGMFADRHAPTSHPRTRERRSEVIHVPVSVLQLGSISQKGPRFTATMNPQRVGATKEKKGVQ